MKKKVKQTKYGYRIIGKGMRVSEDTEVTGLNNNDLILGGTGSGKTGSYIYPNIKCLDGNSLIVSDTKKVLFRIFSKELEEKGYKVHVLDFVHPEKSCGWNPLSYIRKKSNGGVYERDVKVIASCIMPLRDKHEPIWEMSGRNYLQFLIAYCMEALPASDHYMDTIVSLHHSFISKGGSKAFLPWLLAHKKSLAYRKYVEITANREADKMFASVIGFVNVALEPYDIEEYKQIFRGKNSVDIQKIGLEKTVLFINNSDTDDAFDDAVSLFYTQALTILMDYADTTDDRKLPVSVRMIMDDFAASTPIPNFERIISVVRSRDIYVSIILQSLSQFESMYDSAKAKTILNNFDHIIYLGTNDDETAEMVGMRAFRTPESIHTMDRKTEQYVMEAGKQAILCNKVEPYSDGLSKVV